MTEAVFFYLFTAIMLVAAVSVVFNRRPIYSVLSLLVAMLSLACLYIMLHAPFVAALQILVYAGAVLVLFLFVIMLLDLAPDALARVRFMSLGTLGIAGAGALFYALYRLFTARAEPPLDAFRTPDGSIEALGRLLFNEYLLPFELVSFIILVAIIAAVTLGRKDSS